jgi:hypothetical protein
MSRSTLSAAELQAGVLEILCYLLASARGVIYEPRLYAPYRLAEGARRLILLMDQAGIARPDWREIAGEIERNVMPAISDEERCKEILDGLVLKLTAQMKAYDGDLK